MAYLGLSSPGGTRTLGCLLVRELPSPLGHRTVLDGAEAVGLEPTSRGATTCFQDRLLIRPDDFRFSKQAPGVGIEPTASWFRARRHYQQQLSRSVRQTKTASADQGSRLEALRPGIAPDLRASKAHAATTRRRECPAGIEPASPAWKAGASADRPRAQLVSGKGGSRTLKAVKLVPVRAGCHRQLACPSVRLRRQESNLRRRG